MSSGVSEFALARGIRQRTAAWASAYRGPIAVEAFWLFFILNLGAFALYGGDAQRPYGFLRRLFGEKVSGPADAYQFGLAFFEAPFYALGKGLAAAGLGSVTNRPVPTGMIATGMALIVLATLALLVPVLRWLRLPLPGTTLGLALFGTPLFYYGSLYPGQTHAVDTFLMTVLIVLLFHYWRAEEPSPFLPVAMGLVLAISMTVRYFSGAEVVGLLAGLALYRRRRDAALVVVTLVVGAALLAVPAYLVSGGFLTGAAGARSGGLRSAVLTLGFNPLNPLRMLFTDRRGLFVWTPVALLGAIGWIFLLRSRKRERPFLVVAGLLGLSVVLSYTFAPARDRATGVAFWTGGYGFSQRYYTSLFPLVAIGLGALIEQRRRLVIALATVATAWSLCLATYTYLLGFVWSTEGASSFVTRIADGKITGNLVADQLYFTWNLKRLFGLDPGRRTYPPPG